MENRGERQWIWGGMGILCLFAGTAMLLCSGTLETYLVCREGRKAVWETILFFGWMLGFCCLSKKKWIKWAGIGAGIAAGTWCHQIFLPFVVSGAWLLGILLLGERIRALVGGRRGVNAFSAPWLCLAGNFLMGAGGWISLICLLSACSFGGLSRIRFLAAVLTLSLMLWKTVELFQKQSMGKEMGQKGELGRGGRGEGLYWAILFTMIFIQLARLNQGADYDSLHYGLRSHYILDNGKGIYENLGNINLVYTYPKGFEILSFPMAGTATYGYLLCFNVWLAVLALFLVYELTGLLGGTRRQQLGAAAFVSMIPGVMNMAITAKSDIATLVCQLCILNGAAGLLTETRETSQRWFAIAAGSCFLSFAMKPTAVVFSTVISLACLLYLWREEAILWREVWREKRFLIGALLPGMGAWVGTWLRTYQMTGVPSTSVFTSIWEKIGFSVRWPYAFSSIPDQGFGMSLQESLKFFLTRLYGFFFFPAGEDMGHVIIAWGTGLIPLFLLAWLMWGKRWVKSRSDAERRTFACMSWAGAAVIAVSMASLFLLWQVDGNYFMLLYVLAVPLGILPLSQADFWRFRRSALEGVLISGCFFFQAAVMLGANWAGTVGFTPVSFRHKGYYQHQQQVYEDFCTRGNQAIWSILSQDPRTRVIAVGEHPGVLQFPCNVQSYYDVTGSGGNVKLVKTLADFKAFLRFAQTEYVYVQEDYLEEGTRVCDVIRYLIEEGSLADIRYENRNMIARVNLEGKYPMEPGAVAEFERNIR